MPHEDASATFSFWTARPPDHRVTVTVLERDTEAPLENVQVRLGVRTGLSPRAQRVVAPTRLVLGELPQDVPRHFAGEDVAVLVDHDPFRDDRFDA